MGLESPVCYMCKKPSSGAHRCLKCENIVHAICGENPDEEEGFGVNVLCNTCNAKEKNGKNVFLIFQFEIF